MVITKMMKKKSVRSAPRNVQLVMGQVISLANHVLLTFTIRMANAYNVQKPAQDALGLQIKIVTPAMKIIINFKKDKMVNVCRIKQMDILRLQTKKEIGFIKNALNIVKSVRTNKYVCNV